MLRVLTVGCFDLLHEGHADLLRAMKEHGEVVVGLHTDRSIWELKGRMPAHNWGHRSINLQLAGLADNIRMVRSKDPSGFIAGLLAEQGEWLYMRADDMPDFPGRQAVIEAGVPIILHPYTQGVSTTELRCTSP